MRLVISAIVNRSEAGKLGRIKAEAKLQERSRKFREAYEVNPKLCRYCNSSISFEKRYNDFCNHVCAAKLTNTVRARITKRQVAENCVRCNEKILRDDTNRYTKHCRTCIAHNNHIACKLHNTNLAMSAGAVRRILLEKREHKCEICNNREWLNQPIPLQVDHIDGNYQNNVESNLRLLCCNCHAQTPTFGIKNKGNGRHLRRQRYAEGKSR